MLADLWLGSAEEGPGTTHVRCWQARSRHRPAKTLCREGIDKMQQRRYAPGWSQHLCDDCATVLAGMWWGFTG